MNFSHTADAWCVIGAGPVGLTVLKNLRARGIPALACERTGEVGGNWNYGSAASSVYASTHLISSKRQTEYTDFPMPAEYPPFPSHAQALEYLRGYTERFALREHIQFETSVERVEPTSGGWLVTLNNGAPPLPFAGVAIANGHHWDPLWPSFPGEFAGETLHARDYKTPDIFRGRRVLVVGAGNSGCDIAVEAAEHADAAFLSLRRGYHFLPKFLCGKPIDQCGENVLGWGCPLWLYRSVARVLLHVAVGPLRHYGLPRPDHRLFETHPIVNSQLLYHLGHGHVRVKPNVERLAGTRVRFVDGTEEPIDLIVYATGYKLSFPFLDTRHLNWREGRPRLYLNAFHPEYDNLFIAGMIQPDSGLWGLADYQAQLLAAYLVAQRENPPLAQWFRQLKSQTDENLGYGIKYVDSPRHDLEVQYFHYRRTLRRLLARFPSAPLNGRAPQVRAPSTSGATRT